MPPTESINQTTPQQTTKRRFRLGPGLLVTAAFIGPGTVVTASKAGAARGCGLLWTIVFACFGTIVLQSLAARVGILRKQGLGESIRTELATSRWLKPAIILVIGAIGIGNAAYQTGNLTGAATGIRSIAGGSSNVWIAILLACTAVIIWLGRYRVLHIALVSLVTLLSCAFLVTAFLSMPPVGRIISGLFNPSFSFDDLTIVISLIGTTIVPYNLFLHASSAASTWSGDDPKLAIAHSELDTILSISLGGLVTASILITASTAFFDTNTQWTTIGDIARQLEPSLGRASAIGFAVGLFAAGLTSSITAPIATAYAVCGCLGWPTTTGNLRFRLIALGVAAVGGVIAMVSGKSPSTTIVFAQLTNGLLLPIAAVFLLLVVTRTGDRTSQGTVRLFFARLVVMAVGLLGAWRIVSVFI